MRSSWLAAGAGALTLAAVVGAWVGPLQVSRGSAGPGITLVSKDDAGRALPTQEIAMSGDGHFVVFGNQDRMVVKDLRSGSVTPACGTCRSPAISHDGRFLAFVSNAALASGDRPRKNDVFVKDLRTGSIRSVSGSFTLADEGGAYVPSISADGRTVAFATGSGVSPGQQAWVVDEAGRTRAVGPRSSYAPKLSGDGRTVVFEADGYRTGASASSIGGARRIGIRDLHTGKQKWLDELVRLPILIGPAFVEYPAPSADGARLAFAVRVPDAFRAAMPRRPFGDARPVELLGIYVADLRTGKIVHRARDRIGQLTNVRSPVLAAGGQRLIFASGGDPLTVDNGSGTDVFVADLASGDTRRISPDRDLGTDFYGRTAPTYSRAVAISADGVTALFGSSLNSSAWQGLQHDYADLYLARTRAQS